MGFNLLLINKNMSIWKWDLSIGETLDNMEVIWEVKNLKIESDTVENTVKEKTVKKETVWRPIKITLPEWEKTGIISMFTWIPRRDRRKHLKNRVRNSSISTAHPHLKEALRIVARYKRNLWLFANMRKDLIAK